MTTLKYGLTTLFCIFAALSSFTTVSADSFPQLASVSSDDVQASGQSSGARISADGRYAVLKSTASNLVVGDTNFSNSSVAIFLRDLVTSVTERISVPFNGNTSQFFSDGGGSPSISTDGRYVVFASDANNLVLGDTNGAQAVGFEIFLRDRVINTTERINRTFNGAQVTQANASHSSPSISADGNFVVYHSNTANLVAGDTNASYDVFVFNRTTNTTERVSVASDETQGNGPSQISAISADGRYIAFTSRASNLVPNDTNGAVDVFVRDRVNGVTEFVSIATNGGVSNNIETTFQNAVSISANGRYVGFLSRASNLVQNDSNGTVDTFIRDRVTQLTERVNIASDGSQAIDESGPGGNLAPEISNDGRYVVFQSNADNLVSGEVQNGPSDVFVRDRETGNVARVSDSAGGSQGNDHSSILSDSPTISADGRYITFSSHATNLVSNDTNGKVDVFLTLNPFLPTITTSALPNGTVDSSYSSALAALHGTQPYSWTVIEGALPPGLSLSTSGQVQGVPTTVGLFTFTVQAVDGAADSDTRTLSILVEDSNASPIFTPIGDQSVNESQNLTFTVSATDSDAEDAVILSANNVPAGASFDSQTGIFSWTPDYDDAGIYSATFTATDDGSPVLSDSETVTITVNDVNRAPILESIGNKSVNEGALLEFTVSASDADYDMLTYSANNLPVGATFNPTTRTFSWTPTFTQEGNYENVEFTVSDNGSPMELDVEIITITVGNVNRAPVIDPVSSQEILEAQALTFSISASDPDDDIVTLSVTNLPLGASFTNGTFSWTPTLSQSGIYVVTFNATDNGIPQETGSTDVVITVGDDPTPTEQVEDIIETVIDYNFPTNIENSYMANLKKVTKFIEEGKIAAAIGQLNAFITKVQDDYTNGQISLAVRDELITLAQGLIADLQ